LWESLDEQGDDHVLFASDGLVDLIVEYARPVLPLFARLPEQVGGLLNANLPVAMAHGGAVLEIDDELALRSVPIGATLSCLNPLNAPRAQRVDAIVVVAGDARLYRPAVRTMHCGTRPGELYVGVAVPAIVYTGDGVNDRRPTFGADRTIFYENWSPEAAWPAGTSWTRPPTDDRYAVHYINILAGPSARIDPSTRKFAIDKPVLPNSTLDPFSDACPGPSCTRLRRPDVDRTTGKFVLTQGLCPCEHVTRVHALVGEVERDVLEQRLLGSS
jgi:hypothetical protein